MGNNDGWLVVGCVVGDEVVGGCVVPLVGDVDGSFVGSEVGELDGSRDGERDGGAVAGVFVGSVVGDGNGSKPPGQSPPVQLKPAAFSSLPTDIPLHVLDPSVHVNEHGALVWQSMSKLEHAWLPSQMTVTDVAPFGYVH